MKTLFPPRNAFLSLVFLFVFLPFTVFGQSGTIAGTVIDGDFGDTLIGANVVINDGTLRGTTTDLNGYFEISDLETGGYDVKISYVGFNTVLVKDIEVSVDETTLIEVTLEPQSFDLGEVVVEARMILNNESTLLRERQKASGVSDAISAESISRSGSSNAADAMEKVTGATVVDGKYVYVRGLGERYSSTLLNGVELPSSDPDKKAVHFDLFPAGMLDNIVTLKTFTPDKPGNFSGGLVDIATKTYPEALSVKMSVSSTVNSNTHFGSDFLTAPGTDIGFLAESNASMTLPSVLETDELQIPSSVRARRDSDLAALLDQASNAFSSHMVGITSSATANTKKSITIGNQADLLNRPLGFVISLTQSHSSSGYGGGEIGRYSYTGTILTPDVLFDDMKGSEEVSVGGMANFNYRLSPNHELGLNGMYTRTTESEARFQKGVWPKELGDEEGLFFVNNALQLTERKLNTVQFRGKHFIAPLGNTSIEWSTAFSQTRQDEPDTRFFAYTERELEDGDLSYSASSSGFSDPSRYFRSLTEDAQNFQIDLTTPFKSWSGRGANLKVGFAHNSANRDFSERIFIYKPNIRYDGNPDIFFGPESLGIIDFDEDRGRYTFGNTIREGSKTRNNYKGDRTIVGGYAMTEIPVTNWLKIVAGARFESTDISVESADTSIEAGTLDNTDILPSVNLTFPISNKMNVRTAFTKTLARPTFREIAPFSSFDFILGNFRIGNPELSRTRITNYDLRWEWFRKPGEIIAFSLFYKDMQDAIEQVIIGGTNGQLQFQNVDQARIRGIEMEFRSGLSAIPLPGFDQMGLGLNTSIVDSEVDIALSELFVRQAIDPDASSTRELQGQSPIIVNADLTYDNPDKSTVAALYFNVFGRRLSNVSLGGTPDVYERPSPRLDFTLTKGLIRDWKVKLSMKNLLDSAFEQTYRFQGEDFTYFRYRKGRSYSIGFTYEPF